MDDIPYLARGVNLLGTDSSVLVSSSKYLNSPKLREWIALIALRKNGPDFPPAAEMHQLLPILDELRDFDHIEHMFTEERKTNPALDAWFKAGWASNYTMDDLKDCAPGTVGGIYYKIATEGNYDIQIVPDFKPQTQWQYYSLRSGQTHDYEHILTGGGFNYMGELHPLLVPAGDDPHAYPEQGIGRRDECSLHLWYDALCYPHDAALPAGLGMRARLHSAGHSHRPRV